MAWLLLLSQLLVALPRWLVVRTASRRPWALKVDASGVWWDPAGPPLAWGASITSCSGCATPMHGVCCVVVGAGTSSR